jgi:hypothetical protein
MVSADTSDLEVAGVRFKLDGANLGNGAPSVIDEMGRRYFGEQYLDPHGSDAQIAPPSQFKSATPSQTKSRSFFAELKRRDVYKVAAAYAVVSWLLIQATSILLPTFDVPGWVMKAFVVCVALGFILSVIIAWVFEMTPEGIKRTADISSDKVPDVVRHLEAQAQQQFIRGYLFALIYAGLGDKAKAIDYLKREYLNHDDIDTTGILVDPMFDPLRGDLRLETLVDKTPEAIQYSASPREANNADFDFQDNGLEAKANV